MTPVWPLTSAMHDTLVNGSFLQNLVAIGHFWAIWPLVDPGWHLLDIWSHQCAVLYSGLLPTKSDGHRAFLSNLTSGFPQLTPAWHLTSAMHDTLVNGSFLQNLVAIGHFWAIWPLVDPGWHLLDIWSHQCAVLYSGLRPNMMAIGHS